MEQGVGGSCHPNHCDSTGFYSRHIRLRAYDVIFTQNTSGGGAGRPPKGPAARGPDMVGVQGQGGTAQRTCSSKRGRQVMPSSLFCMGGN